MWGGFTIIETMLFLAISGLLVVGILGGAGYAINVQRYKDSVNSLQSYVEGEYDRTMNTQNDRSNSLGCSAGTLTEGGSGMPRGTTDCLIVGRLLTVSDDGKSFTSQTVYAAADGSQQSDDISSLKASTLFVSDVAEQATTYTLEWGTAMTLPNSGTTPAGYKLLIVRSPSSGTIRTFSADGMTTIDDMITDTARTDVTLCVDPQGLSLSNKRALRVLKDAANASAVKLVEGAC